MSSANCCISELRILVDGDTIRVIYIIATMIRYRMYVKNYRQTEYKLNVTIHFQQINVDIKPYGVVDISMQLDKIRMMIGPPG